MSLSLTEAIEAIADGHTFWSVGFAKEVCRVFGLRLPKKLIQHYEGQADANPNNESKGLWLLEDGPTDGVYSLDLSYYVAQALGLGEPGAFLHGRGSQAQWNAKAVKELLMKQGKLTE